MLVIIQGMKLTTHSLVLIGIYYIVWAYVLPRFRGYRIRQTVVILDNGAQTHELIKVPVEDVAEWDATHDALGRSRGHVDSGSDVVIDAEKA